MILPNFDAQHTTTVTSLFETDRKLTAIFGDEKGVGEEG